MFSTFLTSPAHRNCQQPIRRPSVYFTGNEEAELQNLKSQARNIIKRIESTDDEIREVWNLIEKAKELLKDAKRDAEKITKEKDNCQCEKSKCDVNSKEFKDWDKKFNVEVKKLQEKNTQIKMYQGIINRENAREIRLSRLMENSRNDRKHAEAVIEAKSLQDAKAAWKKISGNFLK